MTGSVVVFTGPTLSAPDVQQYLSATCAPPVAQGEVYQASLDRPWAIAIIDGYFERVPAVWHKEILWAMAQGIRVFGAASMGALRAAELAAFGMVGVGRIFEAYRDGLLADDDEVAVRHEPAAAGFRPVCEAMVNIRATVAAAQQAGIVGDATADVLIAVVKRQFYAERTYESAIELARAAGAAPADLDRLRSWLPAGRLDQKRRDAIELLEEIARIQREGCEPMRATFHFEHTDMWEQVGRRGHGARLPGGVAAAGGVASWRDEAWLAGPARFEAAADAAFSRAVALEEARRQGGHPTPAQVAEQIARFRAERGLGTDEALDRWLDSRALPREWFVSAMADEARLNQLRALFFTETSREFREALMLQGAYGALAERARRKEAVLTAHGVHHLSLLQSGLSEADLLRWYFEELLGTTVPADIDRFAAGVGCTDRHRFITVLLHEWWFRRLSQARVTPS